MSLTPGVPPAAGSAPPAALGSAPNALALLKALRRCWVRAAAVGVVLAAGAAAAAWFLTPPSKHLARTLMHVQPDGPYVVRTGEAVQPLGDFQRNQVALAKSRLVLNAALKRPGVGELAIIRNQPEPLEWLEKEVQADFSVAPEILRIAVSGDNPEELKVLVNALRDAYKTEILDKERGKRNERLVWISQQREANAEKLRTRQENQRSLELQGVAKDAGVRNLIQTFTQMQLSWVEKDLMQTQSDLRKNRVELATLRQAEKNLGDAAVPDAEVQDAVGQHPQVKAQQELVAQWKQYVEDTAKASARADLPKLQSARKTLADAEQSLADLKKKLAPEVGDRLRAQKRKDAAAAAQQLNVKVVMLEAQEKDLREQVNNIQQAIQKTVENTIKHDRVRDETTALEEITKQLAADEERLRVELQAPERFSVIEDAVVLRASDDKRLIMAAGGAFAGTLGLVLLAFAFLEFRARRIDTVEEVVHGLGMNLVGTIPDSSAKGAAAPQAGDEAVGHNTLAEAVDSTRVMLLRAARSEGLRVVMVTSAHSGEGKTSLSTHLAASLAQAGLRTLFIDGDLRNPIAHQVFGVEFGAGFCELLRGEAAAEEVIRPTPVDRLSLMTAGRWNSRASRALAQEGVAAAIVRRLREQFDFVVIDSSPVLPVVDPLLIGQLADGTILSVLRDVSRMPSVYAAHQRLTAGGVRVLGAVVNGVRGEAYGTAYPYRQTVPA